MALAVFQQKYPATKPGGVRPTNVQYSGSAGTPNALEPPRWGRGAGGGAYNCKDTTMRQIANVAKGPPSLKNF